MKFVKLVTVIGVVATMLSSCIKEDMSDCPPTVNTELTFSYMGDTNDATMFRKMIDRVNLYVFDLTDGRLVLTKTVEKAELVASQGTELYLPEGDYRIVTWANAFDDTEILSDNMATGRVHAPAFGTTPQGRITTNDHLYFGKLDITVPATATLPAGSATKVTGDIPHVGAHINIEVYVSGVGFENDPASWPVVKLSSLMPQYDLLMGDAQPYATTYYPTVAWSDRPNVSQALFQTLRFADDNKIVVSIEKQDGTLLHTIDLKSFMQANSISVDDKNEATVSLLIKFYDGQFSISIPDWESKPVDPNL